MPFERELEGRVAVITGAGRSIGRAMAIELANAGCNVVVNVRSNRAEGEEVVKAVEKAGGRGMVGVADVIDPKAVNAMVDAALQKFGRIDTLINVAGVNRRKPAEMLTEDDFDFIMDVNFKGAFLLSQAVGKRMLQRGAGNQINIASLNNHNPLPWVMPYAASKAALGHMTRVLAMEWGPRGVRVNAIAPGFILTDLTQKLWTHPVMAAWGKKNTPLGRIGRPRDMIGAAVFLRTFDSLPDGAGNVQRLGKVVGVVLALAGAAQLMGVAAGGRDPLQPLAHLVAVQAQPSAAPAFQPVRSVAELDAARHLCYNATGSRRNLKASARRRRCPNRRPKSPRSRSWSPSWTSWSASSSRASCRWRTASPPVP